MHRPSLRPSRARARAALVASWLIAGLLLGGLVPNTPALATTLPPAPTSWASRTFSAPAERLLAALTNQSRAAAGLAPLALDVRLAALARWRSRDMAERSYFSHQIPPTGETVLDVMRSQGIRFGFGGENIAWDSASASAATTMAQQEFMGSSLHRDNIMQPQYDAMGVGAYRSAAGVEYFTVIFMDGPPVTATSPLAATGHVGASIRSGGRVTAWTSPSGGASPYRIGWYLDGHWVAGGARSSFIVRGTGTHLVGLVVVDARHAVVRHSYRVVATP